VGGTGKTPHTEYVANLLKDIKKTAVLSRGYGRKSSGYHLAISTSTANIIGDEPLQIFNTIKNIDVAVCEDRATGVERLIKEQKSEVVILDDAFQHRKITGSLYILLTTYNDLFYNDFVLPAGNLRETSSNKSRADIIIVTKCLATLSESERKEIMERINPTSKQKVYFSTIDYKTPIGFKNDASWVDHSKTLLVTGIVNPKPIEDFLIQRGNTIQTLKYKDHHNYSQTDINTISKKMKLMGNNVTVITTSKDAVKLKPLFEKQNFKPAVFELPIQVSMLFNQDKEFQKNIIEHVSKI
jgi:tetraacyldisaccharide 4'-kinase